jgi:tRNA (cytidine/uridine-2'-O-)-methyltransferase
MLNIVLYQPEIPPKTGNIIRLCANTGCSLHLIEPLGFELDDKRMRRAGLDYREFANITLYPDLPTFRQQRPQSRLLAITTKGQIGYHQVQYRDDDALLFGPETRGLPQEILDQIGPEACLRIPMMPESRSLNLSNAAALVAYEALRQLAFPGLD